MARTKKFGFTMSNSAKVKKSQLIKEYRTEKPGLSWQEAEAKAVDYLHLHGYFPSLSEAAKMEMLTREVKLMKTFTQNLLPSPEPTQRSKKKSQAKKGEDPPQDPSSHPGTGEENQSSLNTAPGGVGGSKKKTSRKKKDVGVKEPTFAEKQHPTPPIKDLGVLAEHHILEPLTQELVLKLAESIGENRDERKAKDGKRKVDQILREHGLPALPTPPPPDETIINAQEISEDLYCHYLLSLVKNGDPDIRIAVELRNFLDKKEKLAPDKPEYEKIDLDIFAAEADAYLCQHKD